MRVLSVPAPGLPGLMEPPEDGADLRVQGAPPGRQLQPLVQKRDLVPGQGGDLLPRQALQPGQTEDQALRPRLLPLQQAAQGGLFQPPALFLQSRSLLSLQAVTL